MANLSQQVDMFIAGVRYANGNPLAAGIVHMYEAGSSSSYRTIWTGYDRAVTKANPFTLDANGQALVFAHGAYNIIVKDADGNTIISRDNCIYFRNQFVDAVTFGAGATFSGDFTIDTTTFFVDSTNDRVGIGTITPSTILHVSSAAAVTFTTDADTDNNSANNDTTWLIKNNGSSAWAVGYDDSATAFVASVGGTLGTANRLSMADAINLTPNAGSAVILDSNWSFDGTTVTGLLDSNFVMTAYTGRAIVIESLSVDGGVATGLTSLTSTALVSTTLVVDTDVLVVDATNNRVGMGTASPGTMLHMLSAAGLAVIRIENEDTANSIVLKDTTSGDKGYLGMGSGLNAYLIGASGCQLLLGANGSNSHVTVFTTGGVNIGAPTGGDKGSGTLNAVAVYDDNTLLTDYVFDQKMNGQVDMDKWDSKVPNRTITTNTVEPDHKGKAREITTSTLEVRLHEPMRKFLNRIGSKYDPLDIDKYAQHWKDKGHLTSMPNGEYYSAATHHSTGETIQRLVETVEIQAIHIETLNQRLKSLEAL